MALRNHWSVDFLNFIAGLAFIGTVIVLLIYLNNEDEKSKLALIVLASICGGSLVLSFAAHALTMRRDVQAPHY